MTSITVNDDMLSRLKNNVVIISGGSSGIGLATAKLLLSLGAKVAIGDISPLPADLSQNEDVLFVTVDVTKWKDLCQFFRLTKETYGRIDHVFCNAGVSARADYLDDSVDDEGDPVEPSRLTFEINLMAAINTATLAIWYMRKQERGGSIVLNSSASGYVRFDSADYAATKHGLLGFLRSLAHHHLHPELSIRLNAVTPHYTDTPLIPRTELESAGFKPQTADVVARSAALLMADNTRHGQAIYSVGGKYLEVEERMIAANLEILGLKTNLVPDFE